MIARGIKVHALGLTLEQEQVAIESWAREEAPAEALSLGT